MHSSYFKSAWPGPVGDDTVWSTLGAPRGISVYIQISLKMI
jgi:hypothetical protein